MTTKVQIKTGLSVEEQLDPELSAVPCHLAQSSLVSQWIDIHRGELLEKWELARQHRPLGKIEPLP